MGLLYWCNSRDVQKIGAIVFFTGSSVPNPVPIIGLFPSSPIRNQMSCLRGVQLKANGAPCKVRVNLSASGKGVHLLVMGYAEILQSYAIRKLFHRFS